MSIDLTQQALNALADAGLGDSPAKAHEAYVIGYTQGHNDALALAIRIEQSINATQPTAGEIERLAINKARIEECVINFRNLNIDVGHGHL